MSNSTWNRWNWKVSILRWLIKSSHDAALSTCVYILCWWYIFVICKFRVVTCLCVCVCVVNWCENKRAQITYQIYWFPFNDEYHYFIFDSLNDISEYWVLAIFCSDLRRNCFLLSCFVYIFFFSFSKLNHTQNEYNQGIHYIFTSKIYV